MAEFVENLREIRITPHVAQKRKGTAINGRTVRHRGYPISQRFRKRVEEVFEWMKTVGYYRKTRFRGAERGTLGLTLAATAFNLVRMRNLALEASSA